MFGISFSEIVFILIIALIVFGPKQLHVITSRVGNTFLKIKFYLEKIKQDIYLQNGFSEINKTKQEFLDTCQQIKDKITAKNNFLEYKDCTLSEKQDLYQPELDFNKHPELFDDH